MLEEVLLWLVKPQVNEEMTAAPCEEFFFFQAEDGIRDVAVTGVQTCALPICVLSGGQGALVSAVPAGAVRARHGHHAAAGRGQPVHQPAGRATRGLEPPHSGEIGRASYRERV